MDADGMKITDINVDCLEKICKQLSFEDLLAVADSNAYLKGMAQLAFASKYRKTLIHLNHMTQSSNAANYICSSNGDAIELNNMKMCLQTLRCFGHLIQKLEVSCQTDPTIKDASFDHIMSYINEYCTATLADITINRCPKGAWHQISTPFSNVEIVYINDSSLDGKLLNQLFPKMRCLCFGYLCTVYPLINFGYHFPRLEYLEIRAKPEPFIRCRETVAFKSVLRMNSQLQTLKMPFMSNAYLQLVSDHLPGLRKLEFFFGSYLPDNNTYTIHFKSVRIFKIHTRSLRFPMLPVSFDHLEEFFLEMQSVKKDDQGFYDFISKNTSIQKLTVKPNMPLMSEKNINVSKLLHTLPLLKELDLRFCKFTPDKAVDIMTKLKGLNTFYFTLYKVSEYNDIQARLKTEWQGSRPFIYKSVYGFTRI